MKKEMMKKKVVEETPDVVAGTNSMAPADVKLSVINNEIYFSSDINDTSVSRLIEELRKVELRNLKVALENGIDPPSIKLFVHSFGGSVFSGIAAMDAIKSTKVPVVTIVNGGCASAGTFLSVVGSKRYISRNSYMLIHQLSSVHWGNYESLKDDMKNSKELMKMIRGIYLEHTKIPEEKLKKILKKDLWFNAEKCVKLGLADGIYGE
jgi:ATP-dependent Clp protease protease subunit